MAQDGAAALDSHEWQTIASAIESDLHLRDDAGVLHHVLPELLYSCRSIHVSWPTTATSYGSSGAPLLVSLKTDRTGSASPRPFSRPNSCLYDAERLLVRYARTFKDEPLDEQLRDAKAILLFTHHWQDRKNEDLRRSWAARETQPLNLWLEQLANVSETCPLHVAAHGHAASSSSGATATSRHGGLLRNRLRHLRLGRHSDSEADADVIIPLLFDAGEPYEPLHGLAHAWHASVDFKVTSCRDVAGLRWMEHVFKAMPGLDVEAASGFRHHSSMVEDFLVDSPKTQWEWAASHALRVFALRNREFDLLQRFHAPCTLSNHAMAVVQLYRAEWEQGVAALEPMNDPVADVLRIHAYGALRSVKDAREAYDRAREAVSPALSFARETLYNRFIRGEAKVPDQWLYEREVDMLAEAA